MTEFSDHTISSAQIELPGTYVYELKSPHSYLRYGHSPSSRMFYIRNIGTEETERNKGYATQLLEHFFQIIKKNNGALDVGTYTNSGELYIKPVVERLSQKYNIRLMDGEDWSND